MAYTTSNDGPARSPTEEYFESGPPKPELRVEGTLYRSNTIPIPSPDETPVTPDELPEITESDDVPMDILLRRYMVNGPLVNGLRGDFMPHKILLQILSRKRVLAKLNTFTNLQNPETYLELIRPEEGQLTALDYKKPKEERVLSTTHTYLRIFALLVRVHEEHQIGRFVRDYVSDQNLPVCIHEASGQEYLKICLEKDQERVLHCFDDLEDYKRESILANQSAYLAPFFDFGLTQYLYMENRLPWCRQNEVSHDSAQPSEFEGGFAAVSRVKIHPLAHEFKNTLEELGLTTNIFALKKLKELKDKGIDNREKFRNELDQLQRFNGLVHKHLVTLLATFILNGEYYFIFPYAIGTLDDHWEHVVRSPKLDRETVRWIAKQCWGLTSALSRIHEPKYLHGKGIDKYGRHGDIKADNILLFPSPNDPKGMLVISDMGLTAFNSKVSRSNIPQHKVPNVPASYRAPELDVEGGKISRLYDIWTLGCLYLELFTWLVCGFEGLDGFQRSRSNGTPNKNGSRSRDFFALMDMTNPKETNGRKMNGATNDMKKQYIAQVKEEVKLCFDDLRSNKQCSQFIHDALDIIENEMLVILSQDSDGNKRLRTESPELERKFENLYLRCKDDNNPDYCTKGVPKARITRRITGVQVTVTKETAEEIAQNKLSVGVYKPHHDKKLNLSLSSENLSGLDRMPKIENLTIKKS